MATSPPTADADLAVLLKRVLRFMPAPLGLVSCHDPLTDAPAGLAMSAIMPVSLEPPAMAVAVNRSGAGHAALLRAGAFCINLLGPETAGQIGPFADPARRHERFADPAWRRNTHGWHLAGAPAAIFCRLRATLSHGTHDLLVGDVIALIARESAPVLGWNDGAPALMQALG
ncbi:MAG TPA: flavin reductase family protein [Novosphingobium sp.]|nr:flavin reductase family protein [Novosphingobium sp.]